ncbi:MAG TPA: hypothetical protein VMU27_01430 [Candidatus Paceibacterota bacterium]|nr:hypothetical protein [Candidatus Paceibacterota bacterium]
MKIIRRIALQLPLIMVTMAATAHAQTSGCTGSCLPNPLSSGLSTIPQFLAAALKALVQISLPIITVFVVYSGFLFVTAQGNKSKLEDAKRNFFFVILGALLILGAWILANIIAGTVSSIVGS